MQTMASGHAVTSTLRRVASFNPNGQPISNSPATTR